MTHKTEAAKPGHLSHGRLDHSVKPGQGDAKSRSRRRFEVVKKLGRVTLNWKQSAAEPVSADTAANHKPRESSK